MDVGKTFPKTERYYGLVLSEKELESWDDEVSVGRTTRQGSATEASSVSTSKDQFLKERVGPAFKRNKFFYRCVVWYLGIFGLAYVGKDVPRV